MSESDEGTRVNNNYREIARSRRAYEFVFVRPWEALTRSPEQIKRFPAAGIEILVLLVWTLWFGAEYLDFDPYVVPAGREFGSIIQYHHIWENIKICGSCAFWNGSGAGGMPAFADVYSSKLHPTVAISTLLFGVVNGTKITLLASFWTAGLAQLWLGKLMGFGRLPRIWSAMMVIVAGHLAGRMEVGVIDIVVATAACSLVLPALLALYKAPDNKSVVVLALTLTGAILGGSGYLQIGLVGILPALLVLLINRKYHLRPVWKEYARAGFLALLLSGVLIIPFLHFSPNFVKERDTAFSPAQPLSFLPLNLLIDDVEFFQTEALEKQPFPYLYTNFIGWTSVFLAFVGVSTTQPKDRRINLFLIAVVLLAFLTGSATGFRFLGSLFPIIYNIRQTPLFAGLAISPILALAAYGLDQLLKLKWPTLRFEPSSPAAEIVLSCKWLLIIPLGFSLLDAKTFSQTYIVVEQRSQGIFNLLDGLKTTGLEWVNPPFGEHFYIEPAVGMGLKLSPGIQPWRWEGREYPIPTLEANRAGPPPGPVEQVNLLDGVPIYRRIDQPYAAVYSPDGEILSRCTANGVGGWIDVRCESGSPGVLIVKENMWSGWKAWRDDGRIELLDELWLEVDAPAGEHVYYFRYSPWDVPLGITLSLVGVVLCGVYWKRKDSDRDVE